MSDSTSPHGAFPHWHGTTILCVRKNGHVVLAGDGQVSMGATIVKSNARKVRRLSNGHVIAGFAGATADALTLFDRLENKLEQHAGQLTRACVELAKDWRTDRYLRRLEAMMAVADREASLILSGTGDVMEPEDGLIGIGSGGPYALAAARARSSISTVSAPRRSCAAAWLSPPASASTPMRRDYPRKPRLTCPLKPPPSPRARSFPSSTAISSASTRQARRRHRAPQSLAPSAIAGGAARRGAAPRNILMIGPTGVGKTEIARRLARLAQAPFLKVEATKFTEVGYVGRDVEQIVRDLVEISLSMTRERMRKEVQAKAEAAAEERVVDALVGEAASADTRSKFRQMLRSGQLDDREIELQLADSGGGGMPTIDIPGMPGAQVGMINLSEMFGKAMSGRTKTRKMTVAESHALLIAEESDKLLDGELVAREAIHAVEQNGIVFIDEIDKICARSERFGADVSREGVQRDLLPLIEGTVVPTKHGQVKTDHILFIASGAFHVAKPADLLPELQGRLPIRVELKALTKDDFKRILTETEASLIKQYIALMGTEGVTLSFDDAAIDEIAGLAVEVNTSVENIGARRLHTVLERLLEEASFAASEMPEGATLPVDRAYVQDHVTELAHNADLSKYIL